MYYPGEKENKKRALCDNGSIELTEEIVDALRTLFREYNIDGALIEYGE